MVSAEQSERIHQQTWCARKPGSRDRQTGGVRKTRSNSMTNYEVRTFLGGRHKVLLYRKRRQHGKEIWELRFGNMNRVYPMYSN